MTKSLGIYAPRRKKNGPKRCPRCKVVKKPVEYPVSRVKRFGRDAYCRDCKRKNFSEYTTKEERLKWGKQSAKRMKNKNPIYYRMRELLMRCRSRAKARGIKFNLTLKHLLSITGTHCPVYGVKFDFDSRIKFMDNAPTLDRFNPKLGYTKNNTEVICWRANRTKFDATPDELRKLSEWASTREFCRG